MAILTPKYLTQELAEKSALIAHQTVFGRGMDSRTYIPVKRTAYHLVILVPAMEDTRAQDYPDWPNYPLQPRSLYETSCRDSEWSGPYEEIARCKALQLWTDRADGSAHVTPHLLFSGDTPFWGGVKREGIVVACSGVQPEFDRLMASITTDTLIALALHAWKNDESSREGQNFLD